MLWYTSRKDIVTVSVTSMTKIKTCAVHTLAFIELVRSEGMEILATAGGYVFKSRRPSLRKTVLSAINHKPRTWSGSMNMTSTAGKRCWQDSPWEHSSVSTMNTRFAKQTNMSGGCRDILYTPSFIALVMPTAALPIALAAPPPCRVPRDLLIEEMDCYLLLPQVGPQSNTLPQLIPRRTCPPSTHITRNRPTAFEDLLL